MRVSNLQLNFFWMGWCTQIILMATFAFSHYFANKTWYCNKLKPNFKVLKGSAVKISFGHYSSSCMRSESQDGVYFVCEKETFCGTGLRLDAPPANANQSEVRDKFWSSEEKCNIYVARTRFNIEVRVNLGTFPLLYSSQATQLNTRVEEKSVKRCFLFTAIFVHNFAVKCAEIMYFHH